MNRFLWFNIDKLRDDSEYFLVTYMLTFFMQLALWSKVKDIGDIIFGCIFSIFFIYLTFMKKSFSLKDVWKLFWK